MKVDLTAFQADQVADNPARVQELLNVVAGLDDTVPFVLLPIRIETRFAQVEETIAAPARDLLDLAVTLRNAATSLAEIAGTNFATERTGTAKEHRVSKRDVENPLADDASERLDAAEAALVASDLIVRDALDGDEAARDEVAGAVAAIRAGLAGAASALAQLRSGWQRSRLLGQLAGVTAHAATTLDVVESRVLPAARLREALRAPEAAAESARLGELERRRLIDNRLAQPVRAPVLRGTASELAGVSRRTALLAHAELARGAGLYEALLRSVTELGGDAERAAALAAAATTIPLLPGEWKRELQAAVEAARERSPSANVDALAAAISAIRSDDPRLNATVVRPDLVVGVAPATRLVEKLQLRIYPDDIAVDTHEEELTAEERAAGVAFWQQTAAAGADEAAQRSAWRALCAGRGARRAAWIADMTEPPRPTPTRGARRAERILPLLTTLERRIAEVATAPPGERLASVTKAAEALAKPLTRIGPFPAWAVERIRARYAVVRAACDGLDAETRRPPASADPAIRKARNELRRAVRKLDLRIGRLKTEAEPLPTNPNVGLLKEGSWTRAARSGVLPERFLVVAVRDDAVAHAVAGAPVPADLKLSIDPDPAAPASEQFALDEDGNLTVGDAIRWMVDYEEAVAKGMAVTFEITPDEAKEGFDRIYVLGVRRGSGQAGASRLEELLDNHHYGESGLALVPPGTPTNNTERAAAGFSSSEDSDTSFEVERGAPRVGAGQAFDAQAVDGHRLAGAFGVAPATFAHVEGAEARSTAEAIAMNSALYAATIGAWLEEHAGPLISRDSRDRLRRFVLEHVAAGGLVPTFRVGQQPYGVLPTTAYGRFVPDPVEGVGAGTSAAERTRQQRFDRIVKLVLDELAVDWGRIRGENVVYATDPGVADPRAHFLELLGLEPVSSAASYRFAVNVAGRNGAASGDPSLGFGVPPSTQNGGETGARFGPFALLERFAPVLREAFGIPGAPPVLDRGQVHAVYADVYRRLEESRAYELRLLNRSHVLRGPAVGDPSTYVPALATAIPEALAAEGRARGTPLLALLLRQSLLLEWREATLRILVAENLLTEEGRIEAGASAHYVVSSLTHPRSLTRWSYLFAPLDQLHLIQGIPFRGTPLHAHLTGGALSMSDFLTGGGATGVATFANGRHVPLAAAAQDHAAIVAGLGPIPAARLETLLREHLDLASHRLDAWMTGLAQRRLAAMRAAQPRGAYVGAYGWVEDLRPDGGHPLATNVPAALDGDPSRPVYRDPESQGFVHAPSINHAASAAILRSGYLSQRGENNVENRMAVNLSSRRTRLALGLVDGVRAGNRLGALLGYRLERYLHEYHAIAGITLDAGIGPLRRAFPSIAGVDAALSPDAAARQVCDGLAIVDVVNRWIAANTGPEAAGQTVYEILRAGGLYTGYPWGLGQSLPPKTDPGRLDGVVRAIDHVADALDAVADLVVAEGVHQIALGNHERAAAVLAALAEGKAPPRPEVVDSPRTGTPVTHRVLLQLPVAAAAPADWAAIPVTPRGAAEPTINAWAAGLLGSPGDIRIRILRATDQVEVGEVSVVDLGLHALDLVAILGPGLETGLGEIANRALVARTPADLDDEAPPPALQIDLQRRATWGGEVRTLTDLAPLLEAVSALVGRSRSATAQDYVLGEAGASGQGDGADVGELDGRVQAARDELAATGIELARLLAGDPLLDAAVLQRKPLEFLEEQSDRVPPLWNDRAAWSSALLEAAAFGIPGALPPAVYSTRLQVRRALGEAAETAFLEVVKRVQAADAQLAGAPSPAGLEAAGRTLFGEGFAIVPQVELRNREELDQALTAELVRAADLDAWLLGAGVARESARGLSDVLVLADANGAATPTGAVAQLPHVPGEAWLGAKLPSDAPREGRLSLAILDPAALPAAGATGISLLVDEWTEIVPSAQETTGVAVHYDAPDSSPGNCVLVAVPPERRGRWRLGELLQTLHDTFELAKTRCVELEHLEATIYGQLLPAITGELVPEAAGGQPVLDERVVLDFGVNN